MCTQIAVGAPRLSAWRALPGAKPGTLDSPQSVGAFGAVTGSSTETLLSTGSTLGSSLRGSMVAASAGDGNSPRGPAAPCQLDGTGGGADAAPGAAGPDPEAGAGQAMAGSAATRLAREVPELLQQMAALLEVRAGRGGPGPWPGPLQCG